MVLGMQRSHLYVIWPNYFPAQSCNTSHQTSQRTWREGLSCSVPNLDTLVQNSRGSHKAYAHLDRAALHIHHFIPNLVLGAALPVHDFIPNLAFGATSRVVMPASTKQRVTSLSLGKMKILVLISPYQILPSSHPRYYNDVPCFGTCQNPVSRYPRRLQWHFLGTA
jgi:hypothetical protein